MRYKYFDDTMSSTEIQLAYFDYASTHRGEDLTEVTKEFGEVLDIIIDRECYEDVGCLTADHVTSY